MRPVTRNFLLPVRAGLDYDLPMQGNGPHTRTLAFAPSGEGDDWRADQESPDLGHIEPVTAAQRLLFALTPLQVCGELGISLAKLEELHKAGFLSFGAVISSLDEAQEVELRFIGGIAAAGCDNSLMSSMLQGLRRPYSYDLRSIYYDWTFGVWRPLPDSAAPAEAVFSEWLDALVRAKDTGMLGGIIELATEALGQIEPEQHR